jgi:uncharacterized protein YjcR
MIGAIGHTDERYQKMLDMRTAGLTMKAIGAHFRVSHQRVQQILARGGYERRGPRLNRRRAAAASMFKQGSKLKVIAQHLGVSVGRVKHYIWMSGGVRKVAPEREKRNKTWLSVAQVRRIQSLIGTMPNVDIAERFGLSKQAITEIKKGRRHAAIK